MKHLKKYLAWTLVLIMALSTVMAASAAPGEKGLDALPAGTYAYVNETPVAEAGANVGQVQFTYATNQLAWASDGKTGVETLTGDELDFFQSLYLSDRPTYDWLASAARNTEGYAGNLDKGLLITLNEEGDISTLRLDSGLVQVTAAVTKEITADTLTISGATRGQPNLLHSCITLMGSTNGLHLTVQGNVVLDNLQIGCNPESGVGLSADKIGGDTFVAGTVLVDGTIQWNCRYANIQPVHADEPATLATTGKDIIMGGMNIGRTTRDFTITTGEGGGDIVIGAEVSVDYGRGGPLADSSTGTLLLSTTGDIIAGEGNVIIGTNTERKVTIHTIGNIQGANVTIKPTHNGKAAPVQATIGDITATGNVEIELASAQGIGAISASNVVKNVGVAAEVQSVSATPIESAVTVDGKAVEFDAYTINGNNYVKIRDIASALSGTDKQFEVYWQDGVANTTITLTSGKAYTAVGGEMAPKGTAAKDAKANSWSIYLNSKMVTIASYEIGGQTYFKLRDLGTAMGFGVDWNAGAKTVVISTK